MNLIATAAALHALAPADWPAFQGEAPATASAPWIVTSLEAPAAIEGETVTLSAGVWTWRVTAVGATYSQCLGVLGSVIDAWQNARVEVDGRSVGTLRGPSVTGPYKAGLTALDTNLRFQVSVARFTLVIA